MTGTAPGADRISADRISADRISADRISADRISADRISGTSAAVAAVLHVGFSVLVVAAEPGPAAVDAAAVGTAAVQALLLLGLPRRPGTALVLFCAVTALQIALGAPRTGVGWAVAAYLLVRHGVPRAPLLLAGTLVPTLAGPALLTADPVAELGVAALDVLVIGAQLAVAGAAGAVLRSREHRAQRRAEDRARRQREVALTRERQRITDELHGVVVVALHRLVGATTGLARRIGGPGDDAVLADVQERAREALAALRRTLVVLRAEPPAGEPPAERPARTRFPRPTASGWALATALLAVTAGLGAVAGTVPMGEVTPLLVPWRAGPVAVAFLAVQALAPLWWRSAPLAAFTGGTTAALCAAWWGGSSLVLDTGAVFLAWSMVVSIGPLRSAVVLAAAEALIVPASLGLGPWPSAPAGVYDDPVLTAVAGVGSAAVLWAAASLWRTTSTRRAAARARSDERRTREALEEERHRIARELHDVVAHLVSAVAVQAGAARAVVELDPAVAREAVRHVEEQGARVRAALPELAALTPVGEIVPLTRDGVEWLLAPFRAAGLPVAVRVTGEPADAGGATGLFAQRILVEALTNTLRHAGRTRTRVEIGHGADAVSLTVADDGPAAAAPPPSGGAGLGLRGMRERARLLGGQLDAGPAPGGGWRVAAHLPLVPVLRPEEEDHGRTPGAGTRPRAEVVGRSAP